MLAILRPALLLLAIAIISDTFTITASLRGVAPENESYYAGSTIFCKDRSRTLSRDRINDDFCDCPDGTDEPGTSACPEGRFYCKNAGHSPLIIFSSRVNDGICDCCDGSDEYDDRANCSDTCWEAGKEMRKKIEKKITILVEGIKVRRQDIEHAKRMMQKDKSDLSNFKQEEKQLKDLTNKLKVKKEAIEREENRERLEREKEEQKRREAEQQLLEKETSETLEVANSGEESTSEGPSRHEEHENIGRDDELSKEELGRVIASRWTGEDPTIGNDKVEKDLGTDIDEDMDDNQNEDVNTAPSYDDEDEDSKDDDVDTGEDDDGDDFEEDIHEESTDEKFESTDSVESPGSESLFADSHERASFWTKLQNILRSILVALRLHHLPVDKSEADNVRKQYNDATSKLTEIQSKISDLEKKLEQDFGAEGEFYTLYDRCFELKENKYVYKVCPYKHSLQLEGHSSTTLGNWDGFKDNYKSMHFVRGDRCWNGPDRTLKVMLRCGGKTEIRDVEEPSRCEYVAEFSTPAVCLEERLAALQKRLNYPAGEPLSGHDEL